jgi:CheY-like chemotaxis protein
MGMDKETQKHLFEPFYTTKESGKGTGLGLSSVYGIVKQNKGGVRVFSEKGQGATLEVYLPRANCDGGVEKKEHTLVSARGGPGTVLLVEDDAIVRKLFRRILIKNGYTVLEAQNGEDAVGISKGCDGPIELMITDVIMPRMGGREAAEQIRLSRPQMKIIYMSGYSDTAILDDDILDKEMNFIQKPFSPEKLTHLVRRVMDEI